MSKSSESTSFKDKIKMLFCAKTSNARSSSPIVYKRQSQRKESLIKKQPRQTLNFEDIFLKLSRKNIVEEQFFTNDVLNLQLQKHIASRIRGSVVGLVKGEFTEETTATIRNPIYLNNKPIKTIPYREQIKGQSFLRIRPGVVDTVVYQTEQTYATNGVKKGRLKNQDFGEESTQGNSADLDKLIDDEVKQIVRLIGQYHGKVDHMVILCSKNLDPLQYSDKFAEFSAHYLFELERVRQNQELVCNIIYLSRYASFLKLNDKVFREFLISQMNLTLEEENRMSHILEKLIQEKFHREIVITLKQLKKQTFGNRSLFEQFIVKASSENEAMKEIIVDMKDIVFKEQAVPFTPELHEPTPLFSNQKSEQNYMRPAEKQP